MTTKMTDKPKYFAFWEENGLLPGDDIHPCSITFDNREECQKYVGNVHLIDGYIDGSLRIITGFELELERW